MVGRSIFIRLQRNTELSTRNQAQPAAMFLPLLNRLLQVELLDYLCYITAKWNVAQKTERKKH